MSDGPEWFAPKRYGFGTGLPISWQGWALTVGYIGLTLALTVTLARHPSQLLPAIILPTIAFLVISTKTTRGGVRWRWGKDD